jgi:phosphoglycerol geranylgeranyltransferase
MISQITKILPKSKKAIALLIDPDKTTEPKVLQALMELAVQAEINAILVGGSLVTNDKTDTVVCAIKDHFQGPVILFPGGINQLSRYADGILFLSLISGRNPEFLIGKQVLGAPLVKQMDLDVYPTGYMLIGHTSSASYMSNTKPIPHDNIDIAVATALAGEMMGNQVIYMDAGSGAPQPITSQMIEKVKSAITIPLIIGGGLTNFDEAYNALEAGADMIVVGNVIEKSPELLQELAGAVTAFNTSNVH